MFTDVFGRVFITSGGKGIDGKGYWYDSFLNLIPGYNFKNATFIAKTVTIPARDGNLPLKPDLQPKAFIPKCIKIYPFTGAMMNAVGISNPGLEAILNMDIWQQRKMPFLISVMPVGKTFKERLREIEQVVELLEPISFKAVTGLQLNVSCPNVGLDTESFFDEQLVEYLNKLADLGWFIDLKINVLFPYEQIVNLEKWCDIITCSNTIPFGAFPDKINWNKYKGLEQFGGGGLSGAPILPFVLDWIKSARTVSDIEIKGCGGIMSKNDVVKMQAAGVDAIELGIVKLLRPWRVKSIINKCDELW